ncbi:MAG: hypothetical protein Q8P57_04175 [Candidatus Pacearchaeota archaeon]|nr:hypothetical protein [Candidatus Pacearchaeota archaeon]
MDYDDFERQKNSGEMERGGILNSARRAANWGYKIGAGAGVLTAGIVATEVTYLIRDSADLGLNDIPGTYLSALAVSVVPIVSAGLGAGSAVGYVVGFAGHPIVAGVKTLWQLILGRETPQKNI